MANHGCIAKTLKVKPNHNNGSIQKSQDRIKAYQVRSNVKILFFVFSDCNGMAYHELLPQGRTVNKGNYLEVMRQQFAKQFARNA